jgi:hypothetical protein
MRSRRWDPPMAADRRPVGRRAGGPVGIAARAAVTGCVALLVLVVLVVAAVAGPGATGVPAGAAPAQPAPPTVTLPTPQPPPDDARRQADEILAGPAYQEPPPSLVERVLRWIGERLSRLPLNGPQPSPSEGGSSAVLAWVFAALLAAFVVFLASRWRRGRRSTARRRVEDDPLTLTASEAQRMPDEWLAEAERLERDGRWKAALRCRFRALIGELIERGLVRDLPGRTSGEFRAEVRRSSPDGAGAFAEASFLFDAAWYGDAPTGPAESETFRRRAADVLAAPSTRETVGAAGPS